MQLAIRGLLRYAEIALPASRKKISAALQGRLLLSGQRGLQGGLDPPGSENAQEREANISLLSISAVTISMPITIAAETAVD